MTHQLLDCDGINNKQQENKNNRSEAAHRRRRYPIQAQPTAEERSTPGCSKYLLPTPTAAEGALGTYI